MRHLILMAGLGVAGVAAAQGTAAAGCRGNCTFTSVTTTGDVNAADLAASDDLTVGGDAAVTGELTVSSLRPPVVHGTETALQAIESGTATIGGDGIVSITFVTAFAATPVVVASANSGAPTIDARSTTGATFGGTIGATVTWIAIGQK